MIPLNVMIPIGEATELDFETLDAAINAAGGAGGFCRAISKMEAARKQNAAMIARDEPKFAIGGFVKPQIYVVGETACFGGLLNSMKKFIPVAKPAITGLTTVHDGKHRGIGFSSEMGS